MNKKTFLVIKLLTVMILASIISMSVNTGNYILPAVASVSAFALLILVKKKVKDVMEDERDYQVAGKAARFTVTIYSITMAIVGATMMAMSKTQPDFVLPANMLLYSTCALVLLYSVLFKVFAKYGDHEK